MTRYLLRRLIQLIPTIFGIYTFTFFLMRVLPGDPATILVGFHDDPQALANLRSSMHLDEPLLNQYVAFLQNGIKGDLGQSYLTGQAVSEMIGEAFMPTVLLAAASMALAVGIGVPLGLLSALRKNSIWDHVSRFISLIGVSIPVFWLGIQLQILFGLQLKWLPTSWPVSGNLSISHFVLPASALCGGTLALLTRMTRSSTLEELSQDYVRTAYSKGLQTRVVVWGHALRNALLPIVTVWGGSLANLLSGALAVEIIFSWHGMGRLLYQAIQTRDYPLMQGVILVLALLYAGVNLLIDLTYPFIDPRIRYS